jgi:hypothetical protein
MAGAVHRHSACDMSYVKHELLKLHQELEATEILHGDNDNGIRSTKCHRRIQYGLDTL